MQDWAPVISVAPLYDGYKLSYSPISTDERISVITFHTLKMLPLDLTCIAICIDMNSSKQDMVGKVHPAQAEMPHYCSHKTIKEIA